VICPWFFGLRPSSLVLMRQEALSLSRFAIISLKVIGQNLDVTGLVTY
jgi:hypothetical protein